jgi:hypothetical protein
LEYNLKIGDDSFISPPLHLTSGKDTFLLLYFHPSVRFQVLTAASMKITVFWDVASCSLIAVMMEAVSTSETLINFYKTARCNVPKTVIFQTPHIA